MDALGIGSKAFRSCSIITNDEPINGWIPGSNSLFKAAALHARNVGEPFLFLEPDAVPIRPQWLEAIESEYQRCGKPFMGAVVRHSVTSLPNPYLEGCAVYPSDAWSRMLPQSPDTSWTLANAERVVPHAFNSPLFSHFWGPRYDFPPTFAAAKGPGSPENTLLLSDIRPGTALYHRNKDGTLIRLLRKQMGIKERNLITVVFPVCSGDFQLALHHSKWLASIGKWSHAAVVTHDMTVSDSSLSGLVGILGRCFNGVTTFRYPFPPIRSWPNAPNWAFQHTARHMLHFGNPWLWLEADSVVLRPDWIELIQDEYERCGKTIMGPVVPNSGHINGVAVYPADLAALAPTAMSATNLAFDHELMADLKHQFHDAGHLIQHFWSIADGQPNPNNGEPPSGLTLDQARRWINRNAALVHRIKDASVLNLLMSGAF